MCFSLKFFCSVDFGRSVIWCWRPRKIWASNGFHSDDMFLWGVIQFRREVVAASKLEHAMEAIKWGADYFIKAHRLAQVCCGQRHICHTLLFIITTDLMSLIPKTYTNRFSKYIWSHINFVFLTKVGDGDTDYYCLNAAGGQILVEKESNASLWTKFSMHDPAHLIPGYWSWLIPYSSIFKMTKYISDHNSLKIQ